LVQSLQVKHYPRCHHLAVQLGLLDQLLQDLLDRRLFLRYLVIQWDPWRQSLQETQMNLDHQQCQVNLKDLEVLQLQQAPLVQLHHYQCHLIQQDLSRLAHLEHLSVPWLLLDLLLQAVREPLSHREDLD